MNVVMSGATGFVGKHLTAAFQQKGWRVIPLTRDVFSARAKELPTMLSGADVVINLAGAPITARWTEKYKETLYLSRIDTTKTIVDIMGQLDHRPGLFISASAVGIYAERGLQAEDNATFAEDFLARIALDWESTALKARNHGIRTVILRLGVVLGRDGGALQKMLTPFRFGLGGTLGDGRQAFSWVHIDDLVRVFERILGSDEFEGVYNLTAPQPTTNECLTLALGRALGRPSLIRIPAFALRLQFGEGAQVLLSGQRVVPKRLLESGFRFKFETIDEAIRDLVAS